MRIGILTGGGDCPGLNAVIRAAVRRAERTYGATVIGFLDGWRGVLEDRVIPLSVEACRGILPRGGTILGTSRVQPYGVVDGIEIARATLARHAIDAVICIGGEGSLSAAAELSHDGFALVGVPKTIDNDIEATDMTFGFMTAVEIATEAIDRLHSTAESHDRVMVLEVMGRHAGHIAAWAGIAGGAAIVLVPEVRFDMADVCNRISRRHARGRLATIVVVAEGALPVEGTLDIGESTVDRFGHVRLGGVSNHVAAEITRRTGIEAKVTILGYVQRGGTPSAFDRVLCTRLGVAAVDAIHDGALGSMVALDGAAVTRVPLDVMRNRVRPTPPSIVELLELFSA
jgi:phosphofructokinase-like protein